MFSEKFMSYPNVTSLAKSLGRPIVVFDLEHTGGLKEARAITEFGAVVVMPSGAIWHYNTPVKPRPGTIFEPRVVRITGITEGMLVNAPTWQHVFDEFVTVHTNSLWVGFNSTACDIPVMTVDSKRCGLDLNISAHLDLMRVGGLKGKLTERLLKLIPDFNTEGAHRALKDALMALALFEKLMDTGVSVEEVQRQVASSQKTRPQAVKVCAVTAVTCEPPATTPAQVADALSSTPTKAAVSKKEDAVSSAATINSTKKRSKRAATTSYRTVKKVVAATSEKKPSSTEARDSFGDYDFLLATPGSRHGEPWKSPEKHWVTYAHLQNEPIDWIADKVGRSIRGIAYFLCDAKLITEAQRNAYPANQQKELLAA